jgi:uncharacterized protein
MFIEGKMRMLFSILFGAGLVMMSERAERRGHALLFGDIYLRRNMWLILFGFLHGLLVSTEDILLPYGLSALLVLYPCRKLRPRTLFIVGTILLLLVSSLMLPSFLGTAGDVSLNKQASAIAAKRNQGRDLTPGEEQIEKQWRNRVASQAVTGQTIEAAIASSHIPYTEQVREHFSLYTNMSVDFWEFLIAESVGGMMLGMALFKIGFLTARRRYSTYLYVSIAGFVLSAPFYVWGIIKSYESGFFFYTVEKYLFSPYELTRWTSTCGLLGILMIIIKSGAFRRTQRALAAVGRTALSNYILTNLLCQFIFLWGPWKLFGRVDYLDRHLVMLGVWAVNIIASVLWLKAFDHGPIEWVWRSLTYAKPQPLRMRFAQSLVGS